MGTLLACSSDSDIKKDKTPIGDPVEQIEIIEDTIVVEEMIEENIADTENPDELPKWLLNSNSYADFLSENEYRIEKRMTPYYLMEDFNGDGKMDIVVPVKHIDTGIMGFVIFHGETGEVYIVGAGTKIKNALSNNMSHIDIWKINNKKSNEAGLDENGEEADGPLILTNPSIQIEVDEVGGGQVYWDGKEYVYFHQTC